MDFLLPIIGFIAAAVFLFAGRYIALRFQLVDLPGGRKQHDDAVPLIGGLVIIPVFIGLSILAGLNDFISWHLMLCLAALVLMGAIDDKIHLNAWIKFAVQIWIACFAVIFGGAELENLGNIFGFGNLNMGYFAKPFSVLCFVLFMNSLNMFDGLDGLAAGFCTLVLTSLLLACFLVGATPELFAISLLLTPLLAFLLFNMRAPWRKKASVFLGDAGSLALGLVIGWFCIHLSQMNPPVLSSVSILWIIALPVIDAFSLFFLRLKKGQHPFEPDRFHLHYRFVDQGLSVSASVWRLLGIGLVMIIVGYGGVLAGIPEVVLFALWFVVLGIHTTLVLLPQKVSGQISG